MKIKLPWIEPFDTLDLPADFEDQVKESFKKFTTGTSTRYTWKDKMLYISHLPLIFKNVIDLSEVTIAEREVKAAIHDMLDYELEEHYALPKDGYCHLWEKRNITDDDYPERREDERPES